MNLEDTIRALEDMSRQRSGDSVALGSAIGILRHCQTHRLSRRDRITRLPSCKEAFGYFVVHECKENGELIQVVSDDDGNPIEFLPESLVVEQVT